MIPIFGDLWRFYSVICGFQAVQERLSAVPRAIFSEQFFICSKIIFPCFLIFFPFLSLSASFSNHAP
ncbi:MAG: hypothetical protein ACOCN1_08220, partial [Bacteroidales bacterium]